MIFKNASPGTVFRYGPRDEKQIYIKVESEGNDAVVNAVNIITGDMVMIMDDKTIEAVETSVHNGNYIIPMDDSAEILKQTQPTQKQSRVNSDTDTLKDIIICLEKERFGL